MGKMRRLQSQTDEYDKGRAPQTTREHEGGAAVVQRKKAPSVAITDSEQERSKALFEKIRTEGLPTNTIVQVLNDQTDDDW